MAELHFDDVIKVDRLDPDGKKYDKVSRIEGRSEYADIHMQLDVNTELYPILVGEKLRMVLSQSLNMDGSAATGYFPEEKQKSLADKFEYVMHGLLYKMSEDTTGRDVRVVVYISFGGLQLMLTGDPSKMKKFKVDQKLFLLLRKV